MPIASLLANTSFDPEAVENLSAAFDDAWKSSNNPARAWRVPPTSAAPARCSPNASSKWRNAASTIPRT